MKLARDAHTTVIKMHMKKDGDQLISQTLKCKFSEWGLTVNLSHKSVDLFKEKKKWGLKN